MMLTLQEQMWDRLPPRTSVTVEMPSVTARDVARASERMAGRIKNTPVVDGLKLETFQHTGAFKARGALNAVLAGIERDDTRTVMTASAGNHAAGLAWACAQVGLRAVVVVPTTAPRAKIERIASFGAVVIEEGEDFEAAERVARTIAFERGCRFVHPFDDLDVIAGQGTIALELLLHRPRAVFVPIGGGGLAAGMGVVLREAGVPLVGVQVRQVDAMHQMLGHGFVRRPMAQTVADGLRVRVPGTVTRSLCAENLDRIELVSEAETHRAMRTLLVDHHVVAEGAGAVAFAAMRRDAAKGAIAVVTGGNVDDCALKVALSTRFPFDKGSTEAFARSGRYR